ncbi:hypothetical protein BD309DRAFT_953512 [Dichomitus squalens]|uniref:Uncharacterized protein n=1 Tax=Dichomitus squalens TaxID=114155 RepID=A0A4Q9NY03_9APHY|nr:hypothetical protein BD309DRAFT_953512 [Dichomitus squalens]TBU57473.1 hypothetical protein BD310DRAFT_949344 [Dichomitus squalens]
MTRGPCPTSCAPSTKRPTAFCSTPGTADASPKPVSAHLRYEGAHDGRRGAETGPVHECTRHAKSAD